MSINIYFSNTNSSKPWFIENSTDYENNLVKSAYRSVYTLTPYYNEEGLIKDAHKGSHYLSSLYDGMLVYMQALNKTIIELEESGTTKIQHIYGCKLLHKLMGNSFYGNAFKISTTLNHTINYKLDNI